MKTIVQAGATSQRMVIFVQNSSQTDGRGLTGLTNASGSLVWYYWRSDTGNADGTVVAQVSATRGTFTSAGFIEIDATNLPGFYEIGIPDAVVASGAIWAVMMLKGATNMVPVAIEIELVPWNPQDSVRIGLTALPNAAAEASGGLPTLSAAQASNGTIQANVHRWLTSTPNVLQSGRVDSYIGAILAGVIAAGSFASGALDAVWSTVARTLTAGTNIVLAKGVGVTGFNDPTAAANADAVWDEALSGHLTAGSTGEALDNAGAGGSDPWATALPGAYAAGEAGKILGDLGDENPAWPSR